MNKDRRKRLNEALGLIDQAEALIEQAAAIVEEVCEEEQEAFENMPESLQQGERGDMAQEAISNLESVELEGLFDDARSYIETAAA